MVELHQFPNLLLPDESAGHRIGEQLHGVAWHTCVSGPVLAHCGVDDPRALEVPKEAVVHPLGEDRFAIEVGWPDALAGFFPRGTSERRPSRLKREASGHWLLSR